MIGAGTGNDGTTSKSFAISSTGGEYAHLLTIDEMPSHTHTLRRGMQNIYYTDGASSIAPDHKNGKSDFYSAETAATGGHVTHNNMQPYITVYMWKRIE